MRAFLATDTHVVLYWRMRTTCGNMCTKWRRGKGHLFGSSLWSVKIPGLLAVKTVLKTFRVAEKQRRPTLTKLAQQYLSAPPTSVRSERLFSSAGILYSDKRSRLAPERAESLLLIKSNFELIKGDYDN